jgi:class 3 adenylate cyclase
VAADGGEMISPENRTLFLDAIENSWGDGTLIELFAPSQVGNRVFTDWWARMQRSAVSPGMARQLMEMITQTDLGAVLPTIRAPTLVTHMRNDRVVPVEQGRHVAALIPGARFKVYPGKDAYAWAEAPGLEDIEEFLTGRRTARPPDSDRVLSTVLFTDIVGSTERASQLGDGPWRSLLDEHNRTVRAELATWRGNEIKTIGDGFLATFDGPARAVNCAAAIVDSLAELNLPIRAGVHTGECELLDDDVAGIAVHIGARVMERAGPGEVLASSTVKDLVFGSGLRFSDRGVHALRGVPDEWRLFALDR